MRPALTGWVAALATLLLAGCGGHPPPPVTIAQARAKLIGLHPDEVKACLGPPPVARTRGSVVLWSFPSPTATSGLPATFGDPTSATFGYTPFSSDAAEAAPAAGAGLGITEGPIAPSGCIVNVVFDSGTVRAVTYAGPGGGLLRQDRECTAVMRRCVP